MVIYGYIALGGLGKTSKGVSRHARSISTLNKKVGTGQLPNSMKGYMTGNVWDLSTPLILHAEKMLNLPKLSFKYNFQTTSYRDYNNLIKTGVFDSAESFTTKSSMKIADEPAEGVPGQLLVFSNSATICCINLNEVDAVCNFDDMRTNSVHKAYILLLMGYGVILGHRMFINSTINPGFSSVTLNETSVWKNIFNVLKAKTSFKGKSITLNNITSNVVDISTSFSNLYTQLVNDYPSLRVSEINNLISSVISQIKILRVGSLK